MQPAEGTLIAGTYMCVRGTNRNTIIQMMQRQANIVQKSYINGKLTRAELVTIASLLEKEGLDYEDKSKIAAVILNRLKKGMRLQIDATLLYVKSGGEYNTYIKWNEVISRSFENKVNYDNPYNTYRYKGLPPGPITNPGEESLKAASNPAIGRWLYYRVVNGKHKFSETFDEHRRKI